MSGDCVHVCACTCMVHGKTEPSKWSELTGIWVDESGYTVWQVFSINKPSTKHY